MRIGVEQCNIAIRMLEPIGISRFSTGLAQAKACRRIVGPIRGNGFWEQDVMAETGNTGDTGYVKMLETLVERTILASRWLLVIFYIVLAAALGVYAIAFVYKFLHLIQDIFSLGEDQIILAMLGLIDASLVASLIVMVMISGYENFVSRFDEGNTELSWLGKLDAGSLKIKVASAIVAISSIHLLQIFLNLDHYPNDKVMWALFLHMTFIASAVFLGVLDRIMHTTVKHAPKSDGPKMHVSEKI